MVEGWTFTVGGEQGGLVVVVVATVDEVVDVLVLVVLVLDVVDVLVLGVVDGGGALTSTGAEVPVTEALAVAVAVTV
jgi:hypothetical protein